MTEDCALCAATLPLYPLVDGDLSFCCNGCHAVYSILSTKNALAGYREHPVFQQALQAGLISNPALLEELRQKTWDDEQLDIEKICIEVEDLWCPSCAEVIHLVLMREKGIRQCVIDYATDLGAIEFAPRYISKDKIFEKIRNLGYKPAPLESSGKRAVSLSLYIRFIVAAFCALNAMMFAYPLYATYFDFEDQGIGPLFAWLSLVAAIPVATYCAWPIYRRFFSGAFVGILGMEALVTMGTASAFGLSLYELFSGGTKVYFDSMTVIIAFVLLGKIIENKAKFSAKESLLRLNRSMPRRGRKRFSDGTTAFVSVKDMEIGDEIRVFSGEKIVLDGTVNGGEGTCDESFLTGEAIPVHKKIDSNVLAGALLTQGNLIFRVSAKEDQSALHKILFLIEQDISLKPGYVRAADLIARGFIPGVLAFSCFVALICLVFDIADPGQTSLHTAALRAAAILLISCPCAIGIAAPLAESYLLQGLARLGAIVRNRACLQFLGKETFFVFDKTGTVTKGDFTVLKGLEELGEEQRGILKTLAGHTTHPIGCALFKKIRENSQELTEIQEYAGKGMRGRFNGCLYYLGSSNFLSGQGILLPRTNASFPEITTEVFFGTPGDAAYRIVLGDRIREEIPGLLLSLLPAKRALVSGDSQASVESVSKYCGFDSYKAQCLPLHKRDFIEDLKARGEIVCMVGDGINDAPALTGAHVSISVVSASDISIQVSDILLTTSKLDVLTKVRTLATSCHSIIKQNLFWAFFYNIVGVGFAACGVLSPLFAAFAMVASSLMVLFNAQRLK